MRKALSLTGIIAFTVFILTAGFVACRKPDQETVKQKPVAKPPTKKFFFVSPITENLIHSIAQNIYRQNEEYGFIDDLTRRIGYPAWDYSMIVEGPGSTRMVQHKENSPPIKDQRAIVYIPFAKERERQTRAVLMVVVDKGDTTFNLLYPQQYEQYGFTKKQDSDWDAQTLFSLFAGFDDALFGTQKYLIKDGRIFGRKKEESLIVTRKPTDENKKGVAAKIASITICAYWESCVYASESTGSGGSCTTVESCTTYWFEDGAGSTSATMFAPTVGGITGNSDWTNDPCSGSSVVRRVAESEPVEGSSSCGGEPWEPTDQNFGKLCGTYQWTTIGSSWYTTLYTVGFSLVNSNGMLLNFVFSYPCIQIAKSRASTQTLANDVWNEAWNHAADKVLKDVNTYGGPLDDFRVKQNMKNYIQAYLNQNYPGSTFNPAGCSGSVTISYAEYCL
jgi:hypothetical protein